MQNLYTLLLLHTVPDYDNRMAQWIKHCTENVQAVGLNPEHAYICGRFYTA